MTKIDDVFFWPVIFCCFVFAGFVTLSAYTKDKEKHAFIELCETMGGVAIVGNYGTKACLKSETLK
jgi:hypothetical protein